jgi:uroporphyrinogen-III decarboxylase
MQPARMTVKERLDAAVNLRECDRVPVGFPLSWFTARHAGITMAEFASNCEANAAAVYKTYQDLGGIDLVSFNLSPAAMSIGLPIKQKVPGKDLPPDSIIQYQEQEIMTPDEYDIVISKGWRYYNKECVLPRIHPEFSGPSGEIEFQNKQKEVNRVMGKTRYLYSGKSINFTDSFFAMPPFETLSMVRSFGPFLLDLYRRPDKVIAAMDVMMAEAIDSIKSQMKSTRKLFGNTAISRSANSFISSKLFEEFVFPYVKELADLYMSANLIMIFHLDQDWLKFLPYFKQLPEGRYILQLDGATDIFEAKKIVGDRMCLMGDVPARLFKLGTTHKVEQYCQKLIDIVGKGSGFILSCGCDVPVDAKFDNVKTMVNTAKNYLPPR